MVITSEVYDPLKVELSITARMTVAQWNEVLDCLPDDNYDSWHAATFRAQVAEAIREVQFKALRIERKPEGDTK